MTKLTMDPQALANSLYPGLYLSLRKEIENAVFDEYRNIAKEVAIEAVRKIEKFSITDARYENGKLVVTFDL